MGICPSKRVEAALISSPEFSAACTAIYNDCLADAQHAFAGIKPYQLAGASARLHAALYQSLPLVQRWVPSPPSHHSADAALIRIVGSSADATLSLPEFKSFAAELFRAAVITGAVGSLARRVPIGIVGIAGVGAVSRSGVEIMAKAMGIYSVGVAAAVYFSLT